MEPNAITVLEWINKRTVHFTPWVRAFSPHEHRAFNVQGDQPLVDIKTKVLFHYQEHVLKCNLCVGVNRRLGWEQRKWSPCNFLRSSHSQVSPSSFIQRRPPLANRPWHTRRGQTGWRGAARLQKTQTMNIVFWFGNGLEGRSSSIFEQIWENVIEVNET